MVSCGLSEWRGAEWLRIAIRVFRLRLRQSVCGIVTCHARPNTKDGCMSPLEAQPSSEIGEALARDLLHQGNLVRVTGDDSIIPVELP